MKKKILWIIIALVVIIAVYRIGTRIIEKIKQPAKQEETRIVPVKAAAAQLVDMTESLKLSGDIRGVEVVNIFPQVSGKVQEILVTEGQKVRKNQTIIKINRDIVGMKYMPAIVDSPITGYVGIILVDRGMMVLPSTPLMQVVNMNKVEAVVQLIEENINRVRTGMTALIKVEAFPERTFSGLVYKKSAVLDSASRTQEVYILIDNPGLLLKHGMFAEVEIIISKRSNILAVPVDSIMKDDKGNFFVYLVEKGVAKRSKVVTGLTVNNYTEIKQGLANNSLVVTLGKENIADGEKLKIYRDDVSDPEHKGQ